MDGNNMNYRYNAPYQQPAPSKPGSGMGIASMVLGILTLVTTLLACCLPFGYALAGLLGILSIIFGIIGVVKKGGKGTGIAGIVCSVISLLVFMVIVVFAVLISLGAVAMPAFMLDYMEDNGYYHDLEDYEYDYDYEYDDYFNDEVEDAVEEWESMINEY